ncbi:MAG TPA: maleylpyruvate isomerase N-terminal domain-containing protein, partial [Acidimicrobiales bacterium]
MSENTTTTVEQIRALQADRDTVVQIAGALRPDEWAAPSGCAGWSTKDLVSHLASLFWAVVDGSVGPDTSGLDVEAAAARTVESRRAMAPAEVLADYEAVSLQAL